MMTELDIEYEKICKKNNYDPESGEQNKKGKNNGNGTALAMQGSKFFKGRCHFCGNYRHKQADCPYRNSDGTQKANKSDNLGNQNDHKNNNTNSTNNITSEHIPSKKQRFHRKCNHCGKWGHKKED